MTESVAELIGFEVACLSVVRGDQLITIAYTGPEELREHLSQPDPVEVLDPVWALGERWGRFYYLSAEQYRSADLDGHWAIIEDAGGAPVPVEDGAPAQPAWDPHDALVAALRDDAGELIGVFSVDAPLDGRLPGPTQRRILERYAAQAERAIIVENEREALRQRVALADAARRLVRAVPARADRERFLAAVHPALIAGFKGSGTWVLTLDPNDPTAPARDSLARSFDGLPRQVSDEVSARLRAAAPRIWMEQAPIVLAAHEKDQHAPLPDWLDAELAAFLRDEQGERGIGSSLLVALGSGRDCLGVLVISRPVGGPEWSPVETDAAAAIGQDLGAALETVCALEREREANQRLQAVDTYRTRLVSTLCHELRTPLTAVVGNLELLHDLDLPDEADVFLRGMSRGSVRMRRVVDDLLTLTALREPQAPIEMAPVDLASLVRAAGDLLAEPATRGEVTLSLDVPPVPVVVPGATAELEQLVTNLVSNAVKYTDPGGSVRVALSAPERGTVRLVVTDDGLGIAPEEQERLFEAFYRGGNPTALRRPGSGLGLAIVASVAERHGGTVTLDSALGRGTTVTTVLPAC
ncbi:sensor histidine kinase [Nocardioides bruguierae]|uniref:sensor histidine kinase n=1 Tax=Nocardioides bruguierae TaxID=2945102 RepID=UPI002021B4AB|nr:ATP-binding protein [Nocardioides bruguierae]MCL8026259.1 ATP-binding protein [Nocardioides bruguierae]